MKVCKLCFRDNVISCNSKDAGRLPPTDLASLPPPYGTGFEPYRFCRPILYHASGRPTDPAQWLTLGSERLSPQPMESQ
jgi:hypothetical protein